MMPYKLVDEQIDLFAEINKLRENSFKRWIVVYKLIKAWFSVCYVSVGELVFDSSQTRRRRNKVLLSAHNYY
jgi:hypothetical protein